MAHIVIDGGIDGGRLRASAPQRVSSAGVDGLLAPDAIAETYWHLRQQHRSAWTHELDLGPLRLAARADRAITANTDDLGRSLASAV